MKDLQSKEHYSYRIHTLLTKNSVYTPSINTTPPPLPPSPHFYKKILRPLPRFFKDHNLSYKLEGDGSHYEGRSNGLCNQKSVLNLSFAMLKNGRTYFKNLAVFKDQTYLPIAKQTLRCSHWAIFKIWAFFKIMNERVKSVSFII